MHTFHRRASEYIYSREHVAAAAAAKLFSRVQLCATPQMTAHQAPPSLGFSKQEHWSDLAVAAAVNCQVVFQSCISLHTQ